MYICIFRIFLYPWKRSYVRWRLCPRWGFLRWCSRYWLVWRQMNTFWNRTFYKNWEKTWTQAHTKHTRYHKNIYRYIQYYPIFHIVFFFEKPSSDVFLNSSDLPPCCWRRACSRLPIPRGQPSSGRLKSWRCHSFWKEKLNDNMIFRKNMAISCLNIEFSFWMKFDVWMF